MHIAIRGTFSRAELRQVLVATYRQVWWPSTDEIKFEDDYRPGWHDRTGGYADPATGE